MHYFALSGIRTNVCFYSISISINIGIIFLMFKINNNVCTRHAKSLASWVIFIAYLISGLRQGLRHFRRLTRIRQYRNWHTQMFRRFSTSFTRQTKERQVCSSLRNVRYTIVRSYTNWLLLPGEMNGKIFDWAPDRKSHKIQYTNSIQYSWWYQIQESCIESKCVRNVFISSIWPVCRMLDVCCKFSMWASQKLHSRMKIREKSTK